MYMKHIIDIPHRYIFNGRKCIYCGINYDKLYSSMSEYNKILHDDLRYYQLKSIKECADFIANNTFIFCLTEKEYLIKSIIE